MRINSTLKTVLVYGISTTLFILFVTNLKKKEEPVIVSNLKTHNLELDEIDSFSFENLSPKLNLSGKEKTNPITIQSLKINSEITGPISVTSYEYIFQNHSDRQLEGSFDFPLAEGLTITRFAMDVNGKLREGVCVEKEKARVAFETTIRKNIDPGLVEMTAGNNFKARVFPIPAKGTKRIIIECMEDLKREKDKSLYFLPLNYEGTIETFQVTISVSKDLKKPTLIYANNPKYSFEKKEHNYTLSLKKKNEVINDPITLYIPTSKEAKTITYKKNKHNYFYTQLVPKRIYQEKEIPSHISILWDLSSSREKLDKTKDYQFLENYLKGTQEVEVELVFFSNEQQSSKLFTIHKGNCKTLFETINQQHYDGGTDLENLAYDRLRGQEILIFSDGLSNLGRKKVTTKKKIYTINSATSYDAFNLKSIAESNQGEFINLTSTTLKEAHQMISTNPLHFLGFETNQDLIEYYPQTKTIDAKSFSVAGCSEKKLTEITANYGINGKVLFSEKINLEKTESHNYAQKMWAIKKVNALQIDFKTNKKEITEIGIKHNLVTPNTSLLVLDRLEDYVEHEITPPAELLKKYEIALAKKHKQKTTRKKSHIQNIQSAYKEQVKWWKKDFKPKKKSKEKKKNETNRTSNLEEAQLNAISFVPPVVESEEYTQAERMSVSFSNTAASANSYSWASDNQSFKEDNSSASHRSTIKVKGWSSTAPYMKKIKSKDTDKAYANYLNVKSEFSDQPSFYIDVATYFFDKNEDELGIRILSNLAEMELENHALKRILASKFLELKKFKIAIQLFEELVEMRGEEPQSYRDLGLAYAQMGENQKAIETLYHIIENPYDGRFNGIGLIVLNEINHIIANSKFPLDTKFIDSYFLTKTPIDIRVVLNWDADQTDVDLWVTDPRGEKCFYSHKLTAIGGKISNDFTQGYGPEEFMIKKAIPGKYKIEANYYGTSQQSIQGKATLKVEFYTAYGSSKVIKKVTTSRLNVTKEIVQLGEFEFLGK
jgi:hypothetical protein